MNWTDIKRGLLYGQPAVQIIGLQQQELKMAMRDIGRLIHTGWIENLTDEAVQRMQTACDLNQCLDVWDEFRHDNPILLRKQRKVSSSTSERAKTRSTRKRTVA